MTSTPRFVVVLSLATCLLRPSLSGQEATEAQPTQPDPQKLLSTSITKMLKLKRVRFRTTEAQDSAMQRAIAQQIGGMAGMLGNQDKEVRGRWQEGILKATLNDDADEILSYRGRMLARNDTMGWKPRRGRLADGSPLPFVLDPAAFAEALAALPKKAQTVRKVTDSTYKDQPVKILSLTLTDVAAQDFALCGALPSMTAGGPGMVIHAGGGGAAAMPLPELTIDIALYVSPKSGLIHRVKTRTYEENKMVAQFKAQIAGAGLGGEEEAVEEEKEEKEEKVQEKDANGKRVYKSGLPVRQLGDNLSRMDFDIVFSQHDEEKGMAIPDDAKKALRIGANAPR